jgi:hypothetical protein
LKPASAKALTKFCITSGRIMSAPLPASRQRDRSNRSATSLARYAAGADVVAEGRRIAQRGALVAADQVEPGERAAGEILGLEVVADTWLAIGESRQPTRPMS